MKRTPASNRMPVQLGALLSNRSSVSAPLNCLHHHLQTQLQDTGNGNTLGTVPGDYEAQPFDMLGISSLPLDIDLGTPASPDGLQPSMLDPTLDSENCSVNSQNRSQTPFSYHHSYHHDQSSSHHSQLGGDCMPESSHSQSICNPSHIHRNSYSDSNSPSVVSSLSSSCSMSPQSTDLSFGMLSSYQIPNAGSSRTSSISQSKNICEGLPSVPSTSTAELPLSNANLSSSFSEPFMPGPITNPLQNSATISAMQKQQQKSQQNNTNNFIFDFEIASTTPPVNMVSNIGNAMTGNGNTNHITNASDSIINSINTMNGRNSLLGNMAKLAGGQPPKPTLPLSSTAMLISTQQQHQQQAKALLNSLSPPIPTSVQIGTPPERNLCTMPGLGDCRNNGPANCASNSAKMNNGLGIGSNHVCVNSGNPGNQHLPHSGMVCGVNGASSAAATHSKSHCKVCGDTAIGKNFGVLTCGSCKIFFRRNCNEDKCKLLCRNNNNCVITKSNRRNCARCRLQKCRDLGMKLKQSRHSREIRRDISADESEGQHCCPSYSAHCSLHHSECMPNSDCCPIPDDLPSLISEDEARRRYEAKQCLIDCESELIDYVIRLEGEQEYERGCEDDYSDVDDVPNDDVTFQGAEAVAFNDQPPVISDAVIPSLNDTLALPLPVIESLGQTVEEDAARENIAVELPDDCVKEQTQCCNAPFVEAPPIAQQVQTNTEADVPSAPSLVPADEKSTFEQPDSDSDVEEAVPDTRSGIDFDSADSINLSHQIRVATFLKNASNQDWNNYQQILGDSSNLNENGLELPEDFEQRMIEFYQKNRKRNRNDVELIKAEAKHLPSKIDHQITELCQMTSFIRINMGLEYSRCEGDAHVPTLLKKELERISGLNKSCQMIDIKPKGGQKEFSISDSLKQGIFYADKSFKLLEKFWSRNPELNEMIMINEKAFDTRKKNLLHMLYHLRGVYNFDDNQDAWLVPSEAEAKTVTYIKLTMFNQSIKKEMTTIHKKYIDSFPKLWREDLTIFNLMTFLLFFRSFDELRSQYKCEKMRYYSVMYLLKRYLENLYGDEQEALAMLHRVLTLIKDLKWLCTECLNACTHSFNLDVLQEVAPNYADLLRTEEDAKNAQLHDVSNSTSCAFSQCKKARCEGRN